MRFNRYIVAGLICAFSTLLLSCSLSATNSGEYRFEGLGFIVDIDSDIDVQKKEVMDFDLYTFLYKGEKLLNAYAGNHPDHSLTGKLDKQESKLIINGLETTCANSKANKEYSRECLLYLGDDVDFPVYIHYWYVDLNFAEKEKAESIIKSTVRGNVRIIESEK